MPVPTPQPIDIPKGAVVIEAEPVFEGSSNDDFAKHYTDVILWGRDGWRSVETLCAVIDKHNSEAGREGPACM